jgi:hypothetical protein
MAISRLFSILNKGATMKKAHLLGLIITLFFFGGCANPNSHVSLKESFLTRIPYIQTDIPEPIEIDLAFMGREFSYNNPTYSSEQGFAIFPFMIGTSTVIIKTLSNSYIQNGGTLQPPQSKNDTAYISNHINYSMNSLNPETPIREIFYSNDKNYGYTCISTQNGEKVYCQAVLITPQKNVVTIEADRIYTGSTDYLKDFIIKAVESVKLVGNK